MHHKGGTMVLLFRTDQVNFGTDWKATNVASLWMALAMQLHVIKQERARVGAFLCQVAALHTHGCPGYFVISLFPAPRATFTAFDDQCGLVPAFICSMVC